MRPARSHFIAWAALAAACLTAPRLDARRVEVGPDEVVEARARLRFATAVVLPPDENILDWICGDAEYWSVEGAANLAFVKPTAKGIRTNVTLVTDKGGVYTLLFRELGDADGDPDLKLFVGPRADRDSRDVELKPLRFEPPGASDEQRLRAEDALARARAAEGRIASDVASGIESFRAAYPGTLRFDYSLDSRASEAPFRVRAMWRDDRFTYIRAAPEEVPALYESRDGKPSMVPYDFVDGLYVTRRLLGHGWLQIGKRRLRFRRLDHRSEVQQ